MTGVRRFMALYMGMFRDCKPSSAKPTLAVYRMVMGSRERARCALKSGKLITLKYCMQGAQKPSLLGG